MDYIEHFSQYLCQEEEYPEFKELTKKQQNVLRFYKWKWESRQISMAEHEKRIFLDDFVSEIKKFEN